MSAAFNDFANSIDNMNRAKAARRQAEEDFALWTGRAALMKCLYQALTDDSHPLKNQEVRDRIEQTAAAACRRGQVAPDQDPHEVLATLKQEFEDRKNKVLADLEEDVLNYGLIFKNWYVAFSSKDAVRLPKKTTFEQAKLIRERAILNARNLKFGDGEKVNKAELVQRAIG